MRHITLPMVVFAVLGVLSPPVLAQTQITIAPNDYTIQSASTDAVVEFAVSLSQPNVQVYGGETLVIQLSLPSAVGVDLLSTSRLRGGVLLTGSGVPRSGLGEKVSGGADLLDPTWALLPPLAMKVKAVAPFLFRSIDSDTGLGQVSLEAGFDAPFNAQQVALGGVRATLTLPSNLDPEVVQVTVYIKAQRDRSSPSEPIPTLMVKGATGIAVQTAGVEIGQYLSDTGVPTATGGGIVADLSTALTAIIAGDNQTGAAELNTVRASLDQLISTGELSRAEFRELWPRILQLAAGMRKLQ
jgi:hypothetical protein